MLTDEYFRGFFCENKSLNKNIRVWIPICCPRKKSAIQLSVKCIIVHLILFDTLTKKIQLMNIIFFFQSEVVWLFANTVSRDEEYD